MVNKRFFSRKDWSRVLAHDFHLVYINDGKYAGHVALLNIKKVKEPLWTTQENRTFCIADEGYSWLQHLPDDEHFGMTTMFDEKGNIIQWYIDIPAHHGIEDVAPDRTDFSLDLIKLASGEVIKENCDDIEQALHEGEITKKMYDFAFSQFYNIYEELRNGSFKYLDFSIPHKEILEKEL